MLALVTMLQRRLGVSCNIAFSEGEYNATDSRNLFLHGLMSGLGGTCVTMPILYIAVGRRLGYLLKLVMAKEHFFARWEEPGVERFNIECTTIGFQTFDDDYYRTWPKPMTEAESRTGVFLRNLRPREELAQFFASRGSCLLDNLRLSEAPGALYLAA